jgi:hypothetical protein
MAEQNMEHPRQDDRNEELEETPVPDPDESSSGADEDPEAD